MNFSGFGMDTITLAGPLEAKLKAMKAAGFTQVMLKANDLVGHPEGLDAAVQAVRESGLRGTGFQVLRDFEGLSGHLHGYKIDIAKSMLQMCAGTRLQGAAGLFVHLGACQPGPGPPCPRPAQAGHAGLAAGHQGGL
jgi:sugar phosphate isomerase/epimerase